MNKRSLLLATALVASLPFAAQAHKAWLRPSQTVIAGNAPWITVDAAVSNDLFYFNHVPLGLGALEITAPDGSRVQPQNAATGKLRSVFDVQLQQEGTYRLAIVNAGLSARWGDRPAGPGPGGKGPGGPGGPGAPDGKGPPPPGGPGMPPGGNGGFLRNVSAAELATKVPKDAKNLVVTEGVGRVETFVTHGAPSQTALAPSGKGIELVPVTHPNDLYAGEQAEFVFHIDGKPAPGLKVEIIRGGTRYRNAQEEITATTDAQGRFSVTWPQPGMYWLETTEQDDKTSVPQAKQRRLSYVATLEVLPQ